MICKGCGAEIAEGNEFCAQCGAQVVTADAAAIGLLGTHIFAKFR